MYSSLQCKKRKKSNVKQLKSQLKSQLNDMQTKMQEWKEKDQERFICFLCLDQISCPLRVCKLGHYACAKCLARQVHIVSIRYMTNDMPSLSILFNENTKCGYCRSPVAIKLCSSWLSSGIDPEGSNNHECPYCKTYISSNLSNHILFCCSNQIECPFCSKLVTYSDLNTNHKRLECKKLKCKYCTEEMSWDQLKEHIGKVHHQLPFLYRNIVQLSTNAHIYTENNTNHLLLNYLRELANNAGLLLESDTTSSVPGSEWDSDSEEYDIA